MQLTRRNLIAAAPVLALAPALVAAPAHAAEDPRLADRSLGSPNAPVTVVEYFSLTCPHCARFARDVFPRIQKELIDTGKLRYALRDFPLDQVALTAAMVARSLPPDRYEPFVSALLASQDRWAFDRSANTTEELWKRAALAGMTRAAFDAAINDKGLQTAILAAQDQAQKTYGVDSTPTFIFNGPGAKNRKESGEKSFEEFARIVSAAASA
jgi:protein-disulfide isomerase